MKTLILLLVCILSATCSAQNVAVLTHQAANTDEFKAGIPGGWPAAHPVDIGGSTSLPPSLKPPWVVMTAVEYNARVEALTPSKKAWNKAQEDAPRIAAEQAKAAEDQAKAEKKVENDSIVTELQQSGERWEELSPKEQGIAFRMLLHMLTDILKSLGVDVKQVEKPTSEITAPK